MQTDNSASVEILPTSQVARLGDRVIATILDSILLLPLAVFGTFLIALSTGTRAVNGEVELRGLPALSAAFWFGATWILYYWLAEAWFGVTLGKEMMGIQIIGAQLKPPTTSQAFLRNIWRPLDAVGFYLIGLFAAILSKQRQRIGDRIAKTIVIRNGTARRNRASIIWSFTTAALYWSAVLLLRYLS